MAVNGPRLFSRLWCIFGEFGAEEEDEVDDVNFVDSERWWSEGENVDEVGFDEGGVVPVAVPSRFEASRWTSSWLKKVRSVSRTLSPLPANWYGTRPTR